jgi:integrase
MTATGKQKQNRLSAVRVRSLTKAGRYLDGNGLYLNVQPSGAKRWFLRVVVMGRRRDFGLGGLSVVSLAEAREEATKLRKIVQQNGDPLAEREKEKSIVLTFKEAAREVHKIHSATWKNDKHKKQWITTLENYVFPTFGSLHVDNIGTPEILSVLNPIWLTKPETARRVRQRIHTVLEWAKASGFRSGDNPVDGISKILPKQPVSKKHHTALPYKEVPIFIKSLRSINAEGIAPLAFEFLILTATRTSEVLNATWDEINLEDKTWTIPDSRMKNKREHRIPLQPRLIEILEEARKLSGGSLYIFPNPHTGKALSTMVFLMLLRRMKQDITAHGFRSSFRDWASERTNIPRDVCEAALAHSLKDKTEAAYKRTDLFDKRRELMDLWTRFATEEHGEVITLRAKKINI